MKKKKVVIIIPTYNEKENIRKLVPQIFASVKGVKNYDVHILVVDDTSPDKTYNVVKKMMRDYSHLHLVVNPEKAGLGGAYMRGMAEAFGPMHADYIFEFDADGSHDPARIPYFLAKLDEDYDFVIGGRYSNGGSIDPDWPLIRKFYSVVGNIVIMCVLTDFRIRDWTSGYRAIGKNVYDAVIPEMQGERFSGYTWQIGFLHKAVRKGFRITEVPINFVDRQIGQSKLGSEYIKNTLLYIFKARFEEIVSSRVFKFVIAGGSGTLIQIVSFFLMRQYLLKGEVFLQLANIISIELGLITTFIINNLWTFRDRILRGKDIIPQFVKVNLSSLGSICIQLFTMWLGKLTFGLGGIRESIYQFIGIFIGMFLNYFIYNKFIWEKKA